jgi:diguanylate cyclase (GGDEF)-like protein/PAS domain S-box-containing protein
MGKTKTRRLERRFYFVASVVAVIAVVQLFDVIFGEGTRVGDSISSGIEFLAAAFAAASCGVAAVRAKDRMRRTWSALAVGATVFAGAELVWAVRHHPATSGMGLTSPASLPPALFVPFCAVAFLMTAALPKGSASRARALLDGITIGMALMFATWIFALQSAMNNAAWEGLRIQVLTLLGPTQDVVFIALVISVFTTCRPARRLAWPTSGLFLIGAAFYMASQSYFSSTDNPHFQPGSLLDCGWTSSLACFGLAAWWPRPTVRRSDSHRNYNTLSQVMPGVTAAAALGLVLERLTRGSAFDIISLWLASCLIICVLVRQVVTSVEEHRLGALLEARVVDSTQKLNRREDQFRALVQHSSDVIVIVSVDGVFDYVSPSIQHVLGYDFETLKRIDDIVLPEDRTRVSALLAMAQRREGTTMTAEWRVRRADGAQRQFEVLVRNLLTEPAVNGIVLNLRDVTERKELEDQLTHQALHDDLTGLANRSLLRMRIEQALTHWLFQNEPFCLTVVDLDDFKSINDSFGHVAGDTVLKTLAERIGQCTRRGDTIVRLGSDEFAVLLEGVAAEDAEAHLIAQRIIDAVQEPMHVEGHELRMRASIGLACVTDRVSQADDIMRNADLALHTAKHSRRGNYVQFEISMHDSALRRIELGAELAHAIENDELQLYYQPTMNIETGELEGVEALLRWAHPEKGFIPPNDFIPIAEESGLIVPIGTWVLRQACNELAKWQVRYPARRALKMNVNLSGRQLDQPDVVEVVKGIVEASGIHPGSLVLEMTESVLMENKSDTIVKMNSLVEMGCQLAIDDFGTGYSSLSYLRQFPIGILKIDRSFVMGLGAEDRREETALVQAIVDLAATLQLRTVAEGIETQTQLDELRRMGCDVGQGYLLARPAPAEETRRLIERTHAIGAPLPAAAPGNS